MQKLNKELVSFLTCKVNFAVANDKQKANKDLLGLKNHVSDGLLLEHLRKGNQVNGELGKIKPEEWNNIAIVLQDLATHLITFNRHS